MPCHCHLCGTGLGRTRELIPAPRGDRAAKPKHCCAFSPQLFREQLAPVPQTAEHPRVHPAGMGTGTPKGKTETVHAINCMKGPSSESPEQLGLCLHPWKCPGPGWVGLEQPGMGSWWNWVSFLHVLSYFSRWKFSGGFRQCPRGSGWVTDPCGSCQAPWGIPGCGNLSARG